MMDLGIKGGLNKMEEILKEIEELKEKIRIEEQEIEEINFIGDDDEDDEELLNFHIGNLEFYEEELEKKEKELNRLKELK